MNEFEENRQRAEYYQYQRALERHLNGPGPSVYQRWRKFSESFMTGAMTAYVARNFFKR